MIWICRICNDTWGTIPDGAVELTRNRHSYVYRFPDGTVHALRRIVGKSAVQVEPEKLPEPPKEATELLQSVVEVLTELPNSQPEIKSEPEIEIEDESSLTSMQIAFRRRKEIQN